VVQRGDSAFVTIMEDRSGTLMVRYRNATATPITRAFSDHGTREATLVRHNHDWDVVASTFMDRWSTLVANPVGIEYVEFTPEGGTTQHYDSADLMLAREDWPMVPTRNVKVTVKVAGGADMRVFAHDHYDRDHRKFELSRDMNDPTLFSGVWHPRPHAAERERAWRRLLTIDVFDGPTLSADANALYNSRQWVIPVTLHHEES
jgi:hypothetical protein